MQQINPQPQQPNDGDADELLGVLARVLPVAVILAGCIIYIQQISGEVAVLRARQELTSTSTKESLASLKDDMKELKELIQRQGTDNRTRGK